MAGDTLLRKEQLSQTEPAVAFAGDVTGDNTAAVVAKIRGREVQDASPSNGQVLSWVNANSRWEPTDPVSTWDNVYANDSDGLNVSVSNKPFLISQSSTLGNAFTVSRNLASASTDSEIAEFLNENVGDDQDTVRVTNYGQNGTQAYGYGLNVQTLSANSGGIKIHAWNSVSYTKPQFYLFDHAGSSGRWAVYKDGHMSISTLSTMAREAFVIAQNDTDQPFQKFYGTSAADESANISTVNGATADMVRISVGTGAGTNTRWVPCYSSATLPATTWDSVYDADADGLTVDTNGKPFKITQTSTSGQGVLITRNLASTANSLLRLEVKNVSDILPSIYSEYFGSSALDYRGFAFHCDPQNANSGGLFIGAQSSVSYTKPQIGIYDQNTTTFRFSAYKDGHLKLDMATDAARPVLHMKQGDTDYPFINYEGTGAAGSNATISTDSAPQADMLQVEVGSGNKRWVPAYTSTTGILPGGDLSGSVPGATVIKIQGNAITSGAPTTNDFLKWTGSSWDHVQPTWDWIYANDGTLDVSNDGYFYVARTSVNGTSNAVMKIKRNISSGSATHSVLDVTDDGSVSLSTMFVSTTNASYPTIYVRNTGISTTGQRGTSNVVKMYEAKRVRKKMNMHNAVFVSPNVVTAGREWTHQISYVSGTLWQYDCVCVASTNGNDYLQLPLDIPDTSTLQTVSVYQDGGGTVGSTGTNASFICILPHGGGSTANEQSRTYATDGTLSYINITSIGLSIDTRGNDYAIAYRGAITNRASGCAVYSCYIEYDVDDIGLAAAT